MALDKNDLLSLTATNKPDNTSGLITPLKSRQVDEQIITATANLAEANQQTFLGPVVFDGGLTGASEVGYIVYSDFATTGSPIAHTGGIDTVLTNDGLGPQTQKTFSPSGVSDVWNASGDTFDFSELSNGDMIDIRFNATVTTTSNNQELFIDLALGQGGFSYTIPFSHDTYKLSGSKPIGAYEGIFLADDNTRLNGGQFVFSSTMDATIVVHGWYCKIIKR